MTKAEIKEEKEPDASFGVAEVQEQFQDRQPGPEMEIEYEIEPDVETHDDHETTGVEVEEHIQPDSTPSKTIDDPYVGSGEISTGEKAVVDEGSQDPKEPLEGYMDAEPSPTASVSPVPSQSPPSVAEDLERGDRTMDRKRPAEVEDVAYQVKSFPPPVLTAGAIDSRLRRVFKARQDGTMLLDETWVQQWLDKEKRENIKAIFEKVGYNVDRVVKIVVLSLVLVCVLFRWML